MTTQTIMPRTSNVDRLGLTLFIATALHAMIILGVSFNLEDHFRSDPPPLSLDIILVHSKSDEKNDDADYLAQATQKGGGEMEEKVRPSSPFPNPKPVTNRQGNAPESRAESTTPVKPQTDKNRLTTEKRSDLKAKRIDTQSRPEIVKRPTAEEIMERSIEIARLSAEIRQKQQTYARKPKIKTITANTREFRDALYLKTWQEKIERFGNINYPNEAKKRGISGYLTMEVEIYNDGTLRHAVIRRSSGEKILDDAALRIVRDAAPFARFSPEMAKEFEVLRIVRTWKFESGNRFTTLK